VLVELRVRDLGVIEEVTIALGDGMTALTGETGAGKTLLVEALELLLGGRGDPALVRPGASEALVEGRFVVDDDELILARAVPASGRSRGWVDGRMAPLSALEEAGRGIVDLHGQHAHQSLLDAGAQRRSLDAYGGVDVEPVRAARARCRALEDEMASLGGDVRARAREADLLRYQIDEIDAARITGADEDDALAEEEERLAEMAAHLEAAAGALAALDDENGGTDRLGQARHALEGRRPLDALAQRLAALQAEAADVASDLRHVVETWEDDPTRLAEVRARRQLLHELSRKYGDGPGAVLAYGDDARQRLAALESLDARAGELQAELAAVRAVLAEAEALVGEGRRRAAPGLAGAVEERLRALAMPHARVEVTVGDDDPGDDVAFLLGANPGESILPLAKVASGGELARAMLALRLVLTDAPGTIVFDEVDAGVGGEAALAVGRALAEVGRRHQVLVVTHLAQVAAFADHQLGVRKEVADGRTVATVGPLQGEARVVELARMLSGRPDSATARRHAEELLAGAGAPT
jgi:DNA repair protein RecN (Recombination protein N)